MSLSDAEIAAVVAELGPRLRGGNIGKVYQPAADTLLIEVGRERLLISIAPRASRLHLSAPHDMSPPTPPARDSAEGAGTRVCRGAEGASAAKKPGAPPTAFAMLLRKHFSGLRLHDLGAAAGERVVTLDFGAARDRLVAELTGPHANVFVIDSTGAIVASQRPSHSTTRALAPGSPYSPPPPAPPDARWRGRNRFTGEGVAARVAAHYVVELAQAEERTLREQLGAAVRREIAKAERRERALLGDLERADEASRYRKLADLLLAHVHELPGRGATSATVPDDFEDGAPLAIVLDPALDVRANAARYYRLHKRHAGGRKQTEARLAETRRELSTLRDRLDAIPALSLEELQARQRPTGAPRAARRRTAPEERLPYREYTSLAGDRILVGRSAADNDALTFRVARGNDLWLHCRDAAGAHVVVPRDAPTVTEGTLLDAATLAAHFSPLGKEAQVDITYAAVKNLRKPKGAAPGLVFVSDAKTIRVRLEPSRLARLLREGE